MSNGTTAVPVSPVVNDLIATINAGQAAIARLPELEAAIRDLTAKLDASQAHAQELELKGRDYRDQIDHLHGQVRTLREERDDASFRELETQDRLGAAIRAFRHVIDEADGAISVISPPAPPPAPPVVVPVPVPEPVKVPITESGQSATPMEGVSTSHEGQSDPHPTPSAAVLDNTSGNVSSTPNVSAQEPVSTPEPWWMKDPV